jgi:hypothetical protein
MVMDTQPRELGQEIHEDTMVDVTEHDIFEAIEHASQDYPYDFEGLCVEVEESGLNRMVMEEMAHIIWVRLNERLA